jgi:anti-sigma-K factor RskA
MNDQTTNNSSSKNTGDDASVTTLLRQTYAAPADAAYWANLEQRVMTRLRESGPIAWWAVFSEWRSAGMVAAAIALIIAGAAVIREQQQIASMRDVAAGEAVSAVPESPSDEITIPVSPKAADTARARKGLPERYLDVIKP